MFYTKPQNNLEKRELLLKFIVNGGKVKKIKRNKNKSLNGQAKTKSRDITSSQWFFKRIVTGNKSIMEL